MTTPDTHSVIVEKEFPHPPEKVWRALTDSSLIAQWLMKNDFQPVAGRAFNLRLDPMPGWDGVINCQVVAMDPLKSLSYTWEALGLATVVTFTLTPLTTGTKVRVEQSGFRSDNDANYKGAKYGWQKFIGSLEQVVSGLQ